MEDAFGMFEEFFKSKDVNIVRGLIIAIELEMKSRNYYQTKSNEIKSFNGKTLLTFLANEELMHFKMLEKMKRNLETNNKWLSIKEIDLKRIGKPRLFEGKQTEPKIETVSTDKNILLAAMSAERKTAEYYQRMSEKVKDIKGKDFFKALTEFEKQHYKTIMELLEQ